MGFNIDEHWNDLTDDEKTRIETVQTIQKNIGMQPRKDSILTYNYAKNNVPDYLNDPNAVANELKVVDYIYQNSNYGSIIEEVMREVAGHIRFKYRLDWNTTWEIVKFYVPDMLKLYCIKSHNLTIP